MSEVRPIPFAPGYFVSDDGHVYSEKRGRRTLLQPWRNKRASGPLTEYLRVSLRIDGCSIDVYLHRLVVLVFIGPPPSDEHEVRHLDGCPDHNWTDNLTWGTHLENMQDMVRHGTHGSRTKPERMPRGTRHGSRTKPWRTLRGELAGNAKIDEATVRLLRSVHAETGNISEAARRLGIPRGAAKCVIQGKTWTHVG
jgi:hypothetical protein